MAADTNLAPPARRKTRAKVADASQLGLFDVAVSTPSAPAPPPLIASPSRAPSPAIRTRRKLVTDDAVHLVTIAELPEYPASLVEIVNRSITDLPKDLVWLTYKEIRKHFGVSRATIARRLKDGLVPGVRFQEGRMLDDGPVRRFDRTQLRWLLLAVRFAGSRYQTD